MKVIGLDGKIHTLKTHEASYEDVHRSSFHLEARSLLKKAFPRDILLEEIILPGTTKLTVDFLLPLRKLVVECHGVQHYEFVPFFHKSLTEFTASKERDRQKKEWCSINKFIYLELDTRRTDEWNERITNFYQY